VSSRDEIEIAWDAVMHGIASLCCRELRKDVQHTARRGRGRRGMDYNQEQPDRWAKGQIVR